MLCYLHGRWSKCKGNRIISGRELNMLTNVQIKDFILSWLLVFLTQLSLSVKHNIKAIPSAVCSLPHDRHFRNQPLACPSFTQALSITHTL
jgi:hypothetical protein